jgi:uncharacterized RDD family membrane protein YckC
MTAAWSAPDPSAPTEAATPAAGGAVPGPDAPVLPPATAPMPFAERRAEAAAHAHDTAYAGLATRAVALAVDAVVINGIALFVGVVVGLGLSLFDIPSTGQHILVAVGAVMTLLWLMAYFVVFWEATGQTPGNRLLQIRVQDADTGGTISYRRALRRIILLELSAILLFIPALAMLIDDRRRAAHDVVAGTVVVYAPTADEPVRRPPQAPATP